MVSYLLHIITQRESIYNNALGSVSQPTKVCDHPFAGLPECERAIRKSKREASSQRNRGTCMLIIAHTCSYTGESVHIALGSNSHPRQECDPPLPMSRRAILKTKKGTASSKRSPRGNT